jgi:hypothetical protein
LSKTVEVDHEFENALDVDLMFENALGVNLDITHLPRITIDPITINPLTINPLTINPLDLSLRIKEIPSIRTHIPANFALGLSVLGYDIACVRLCGEAQVINEPYRPNPCEVCGRVHHTPHPTPVPQPEEPEVPK